MDSNPLNIALVSNDSRRLLEIKLHLNHANRNIAEFEYNDSFQQCLDSDSFDLVIFDCPSFSDFNFKNINRFRLTKNNARTPFLFILNEKQLTHRVDIYKDEYTGFVKDPMDKFEFLLQVKNLVAVGQLEKRVFLYNDVLESEKKLIFYLDDILQISSLSEFKTVNEFVYFLHVQFVRRMELTFAVESVAYLEYESASESLILKKYDEKSDLIKNKDYFSIEKSKVKNALRNNSPILLEGQDRLDPFIQEIEETIGFEINSLLFIPFLILHKPRGGFAIINKLYRNSFSENDLALSLITIQKLVFQYETILLKNLAIENFESILEKNYQKDKVTLLRYGLYENILNSVEFGLIVFNKNYDILYLNKFASDTLSTSLPENPTLKDVIGDDASNSVVQLFENKDIPSIRQEMMVNFPDKKPLYLGYSIYNISTDKNDMNYALTFMEISQTKRLQAEIIQMDRMASLGVLASGIAHEIRNPLAGIKAMAQTLEDELQEDKAKVEYVERIVRQVNRLDELLKSFFSYAKPQRPNPIQCNIQDIVHEVLPLFHRKIKDNNIVVKETYSKDLQSIFVDFHQIQQVIFNLIINAIDAMKDGGTLKISARLPEETQVIVDRRKRVPKLFSDIFNEITISDTGTGMNSDTIKNIYNPFFTTKSSGTGLGLSIVYQIILEHGGQIMVESELGKGSTFNILLPVYVKSQHEKQSNEQ